MKRIAAERKTRIVNGAGFLSGVIAIEDAFGEAAWRFVGGSAKVRRLALGADVAVLAVSFLRLVVNKGSDHLGADRRSREMERQAVGFSRGGSTARNSCANLCA
jgi:hypothetical protein